MTADEVVAELKALGKESYKATLMNHCVTEPVFGTSIADMKKIQKRIKTDYQLALDLYDTGIYDAMYFAGLIADDAKMSKKDLQAWVERAYCPGVSEFTVAWVAAGSLHGRELALKWIDSKKENIAATGWATLGSLVAITADRDLDLGELKKLLQRVEKTIHHQPNRVKYTMNGFVIAVGGYVKPLSNTAIEAARNIGAVAIDLPGTACKVPYAPEYIEKMKARGTLGKKRKSAKC
jgi:3-methyladenine DNA glycosylase AlkD